MAEQAELAFIKSFSSNLATLPLQYPDDYAQPPQNSLKRVPVLQVRCAAFARLHDSYAEIAIAGQLDLPPPPKRIEPEASTSTGAHHPCHDRRASLTLAPPHLQRALSPSHSSR